MFYEGSIKFSFFIVWDNLERLKIKVILLGRFLLEFIIKLLD